MKRLLFAILTLFVAAAALAATPAYVPTFQPLDDEGEIVPGGKLYTYIAGSNTPKAVYQDESLTTAHTNPVILDAAGRATIYLDGSYKFVLQDSDDVTLWTVDNVDTSAISASVYMREMLQLGTATQVKDYLEISDRLNYLNGLEMSYGTDTDHDLAFQDGEARDADDTEYISLNATVTKQIDADWAYGNNQGGLDDGTVAASTIYYIYLINNDTDLADVIYSTNATRPSLPSGYTKYRAIGRLETDDDANIDNFAPYANLVKFALDSEALAHTDTEKALTARAAYEIFDAFFVEQNSTIATYNGLLTAIRTSKQSGAYEYLVNGVVDGFSTWSGVSNSTSGFALNATGQYFSNDYDVDNSTGTIVNDGFTSGGGANAAFDNDFDQTQAQSAWVSNPIGKYLGKNWGTQQVIQDATIYCSNDEGCSPNSATVTVYLYGSNDNFSTSTLIGTLSFTDSLSASASFSENGTLTDNRFTPYQYHAILSNMNPNDTILTEIVFTTNSTAANNGQLISTPVTAQSEPSTATGVFALYTNGTVGEDDVYVSFWSTDSYSNGTLTYRGIYSTENASIGIYTASGAVTGTEMKWMLGTNDKARLDVYGAAMQWQ